MMNYYTVRLQERTINLETGETTDWRDGRVYIIKAENGQRARMVAETMLESETTKIGCIQKAEALIRA